jgi:flagellar basal-body rod modification protein FlgD
MHLHTISSQTPAAVPTAKAAATNSSSSSATSSSNGLDPTFMSLLLAELQSQDPTAPMDTTAMVGQMVSLNQLDELISIQGILQNSLGSGSAASGSTATGSAGATQDSQAARQAATSNAQAGNAAQMAATAPISNAQSAYAMIAGTNVPSTQSMYGAN